MAGGSPPSEVEERLPAEDRLVLDRTEREQRPHPAAGPGSLSIWAEHVGGALLTPAAQRARPIRCAF
jgi:hypothetical protein